MNFEELQKNWNNQQDIPTLNEKGTSQLIKQRILKMEKSKKLLLFFSILAAFLAISLLLFWAYLFLTVGTIEMRKQDIYPPFGWFIMFPLFVALAGCISIYNYLSQGKKNNRFDQKLDSLLEIRKIQIESRISLLQKIPFIYLLAIIVINLGQLVTPEFSYFYTYPLILTLSLFIPDIIIITLLIWWSRKKIQKKYKPQLIEINLLIQKFNINS